MSGSAEDKDPGRVVAGVGGTSTGTAVVGLGLLSGPETTLGRVLLLASPATSVVTGSLFYYLHLTLNRWLEDREATRARETLKRALDDPDVPDDDKVEFRKLLANHHRGRILRQFARVDALGDVPERSAQSPAEQ
jgi:hypothetical protein